MDERRTDLHFEIRGNGCGFDPGQVSQESFQNMSDRIGALSGTVLVESAPGRGTRVSGSVPRVDRD